MPCGGLPQGRGKGLDIEARIVELQSNRAKAAPRVAPPPDKCVGEGVRVVQDKV